MRRLATVLIAGLLALEAPAAEAGLDSCGGFSPVVSSCRLDGILSDFSPTSLIHVGPVYTGYVAVSIRTVTGGYLAACSYLVGSLQGCREAYENFVLPGQEFTLFAQTGLAFVGPDLRGAAVGRWQVRHRQA